MASGPEPSSAAPDESNVTTTARDRFSIWSIVLIVLTVGLQVYLSDGGEILVKKALGSRQPISSSTVTTDSFEQLVQIDTSVKAAYCTNYLPPSVLDDLSVSDKPELKGKQPPQPHLSAFHANIKKALDNAQHALVSSPNSIYFARRVILLRSVLDIPPLGPVRKYGKNPGLSSPLQSWELAANESPIIRPNLKREENFWKINFSDNPIPRNQLAGREAQLKDFPTLLFYSRIARQQLCLRAGVAPEAKAVEKGLEYHSLISLLSFAGLLILILLIFVVGICVLGFIGLTALVRTFRSAGANPDLISQGVVSQSLDSISIGGQNVFMTPLPDRISAQDRGLRAGDLLDCFAIYLLLLTGVSAVLGQLFRLVPTSALMRLSEIQLIYLEIGLTLLSYVGGSWLALLFLKATAKKRGASLGIELGLSTKMALSNIAVGIAGWGAGIVLLFAVGGITDRLFHELPAPENPALPMLSFAPDTVSRVALYGLAAIAAPFFEETFFRGVLLNALLLRYSPVYACLITGLLFGSIHPVGVAQALSLASLGAVFAWMAYLRKSLMPSMFGHFLQNTYACLAVYFSCSMITKF